MLKIFIWYIIFIQFSYTFLYIPNSKNLIISRNYTVYELSPCLDRYVPTFREYCSSAREEATWYWAVSLENSLYIRCSNMRERNGKRTKNRWDCGRLFLINFQKPERWFSICYLYCIVLDHRNISIFLQFSVFSWKYEIVQYFDVLLANVKGYAQSKNRNQRIRISTYQKLCVFYIVLIL